MTMDKSTLIAIATTHPILSVRRAAAHSLFSLGCVSSAVVTANAIARERSQELSATAEAQHAIQKASGVQP